MRTILAVVIAITIAFSFSEAARAQEVTRMPADAQHSVGVDAGLESAFIARAAYGHRVDLGVLPEARLVVRFTLPVVGPDLGDWAIDAGLQASVLSFGDFRVALLVAPVLRRTENDVFSATALGVGATALVGWQGPRWGLSAEASYEQMLTAHLSHSSLYRDVYYADAKDGWYAFSASHARAGLRGGLRVGAVEFAARAGVDATGRLHATIPPYYATLGSTYAF